MAEKVYTNYHLLLPQNEILGTLVVQNGIIADIQPGIVPIGQNGNGDYLLPGLIELHTDHVEQCVSPRPNVQWPLEAAVVYHDQDLISAGITTVCDAISIGDFKPTSSQIHHFKPLIDALQNGQNTGRFLADHYLHLRFELSYPDLIPLVETYLDHPLLSLISVMDHTPGQRQFKSIEKYTEYYTGKYGISAEQMNCYIQNRLENQQKYAAIHRKRIVELSQNCSIPFATHDDSSVEQVQQARREGAIISEFPTTLEAAQTAHELGLKVLIGAPNIILGRSHSGNISALTLAENQWVDILSSDYAPRSLLHATFKIAKMIHQPLHETIKFVTQNPAKIINLDQERGSLEIGKQADLVTVRDDGIVPRITSVIRQGQRIA